MATALYELGVKGHAPPPLPVPQPAPVEVSSELASNCAHPAAWPVIQKLFAVKLLDVALPMLAVLAERDVALTEEFDIEPPVKVAFEIVT